MERIKQIYQKAQNGFNSPIPLGTDGGYIDMLSGLDLEEELKLGGNHFVNIEQKNNNEIVITEYYGTNKKIYNYKVTTTITELIDDNITKIYLTLQNSNEDLLHTKLILVEEDNVQEYLDIQDINTQDDISLQGVWTINNNPDVSTPISFQINMFYTPQRISTNKIEIQNNTLYYQNANGSMIDVYSNNQWNSNGYRLIDIRGGNNIKNLYFSIWLQTNATRGVQL